MIVLYIVKYQQSLSHAFQLNWLIKCTKILVMLKILIQYLNLMQIDLSESPIKEDLPNSSIRSLRISNSHRRTYVLQPDRISHIIQNPKPRIPKKRFFSFDLLKPLKKLLSFFFNLFSLLFGFLYSLIVGFYGLIKSTIVYFVRIVCRLQNKGQLWFYVFVLTYILLIFLISPEKISSFHTWVRQIISKFSSEPSVIQRIQQLNCTTLNEQCVY